MSKISVDFKKDKNNNFLVERISFKNQCLTEDSICLYCSFYSGIKCHGHGDYWGNCSIYKYINKDYNYFDDVVYDKTKCIVFKYLKSIESED